MDKDLTLAQISTTNQVSIDAKIRVNGLVQQAKAAGATWAEIGEALGVSRQAAYERFSKR